jgi:regulator of protease activity HflC (stomatin/prohibitin superfamily)
VTAVLLGIIGYYLRDFFAVRFASLGSFIWVIAFVAGFFFGLVHYSQFILPIGGLDGWGESLNLLGRYFFDKLINAGRILYGPAPRPGQATTSRPAAANVPRPGWSPSFRILRAGITKNHEVLALTRGPSFSRAAGPGFVRLSKGEMPTMAIDLRAQLRTEEVKTNTRDGIPVETTVTVIFRVRQSHIEDEEIAYPYDREAIFNVSYARSTDGRDGVYTWTEQLAPRAAALLADELGQQRLNDLYQEDTSVAPLDMIQQKIKRQLDRDAERLGLEVLILGIGHLCLPDKVKEQRIKTWQADWMRQINVQHAEGEAEAERRLKNARARAQIEIIHNITQNIDAMRRAGNDNLTQIVMLRMIEALEEATADPVVQLILPQGLIVQLVEEAADQMKDWLLEAGDKRRV